MNPCCWLDQRRILDRGLVVRRGFPVRHWPGMTPSPATQDPLAAGGAVEDELPQRAGDQLVDRGEAAAPDVAVREFEPVI
jgi:hypothetical protein